MNRPRVVLMLLISVVVSPSWAIAQESSSACPRDVSFWAEQCEGYRAEICPDGMQRLARQVMDRSHIGQWRRSDGSFQSRADLVALSDSSLVTALCTQLEERDDSRDRSEAEYIALLLNVSVGALPLDSQISYTGPEGIGKLVDALEKDLNQNSNLDTWQQIVEQVNQGHIDAPECPDPDQIFRHVSPCGD